jgi:hypothetical protein
VSTLQLSAAEPVTIALADLTLDPELACRAEGVDAATVEEYAEAMKAGAAFPAVVVFQDGKSSWLADGWHRCAAAELAGLTELPADVRQGGRREALLHAAGANAAHGLRRTRADVQRAIAALLEAFPKWSDRKIAAAVGVHNETVGAVRKRLTESVTSGAADGSEPAPPDLDRLVARLTKALTRVFEQWPAERRAELRKLLDAADAAASQ